VRGAVVVRHGEIDRLDALLVLLLVHRAVRAPDGVARLDAKAGFQRIDEAFEEIDEKGIGAAHHRAHVVVDERGKDDRLAVVRLRGDAGETFLGLLRGVDERQRDLVELHAFELGEQAVTEHLRGDAGAVRDEEHGSALAHGR
jgi:hypothetical protein